MFILSLFSNCTQRPRENSSSRSLKSPSVFDQLIDVNLIIKIINSLPPSDQNRLRLTAKKFSSLVKPKKLELIDLRLGTDSFKDKATYLASLRTCSIHSCQIRSADVLRLFLEKAPNLQEIEISEIPLQSDLDSPLSSDIPRRLIDNFAALAITHTALQALRIINCKVTRSNLARLSPCMTRLKHFELSNNVSGERELNALFSNVDVTKIDLETLDLSRTIYEEGAQALVGYIKSGLKVSTIIVEHMSDGQISALMAETPHVKWTNKGPNRGSSSVLF